MLRCKDCGRTYEDESLRYCMNCGAPLQGPESIHPVSGRARKKRMMILVATFAVAAVLILAAGQYFLREEEESGSMVRTNTWVFDVDRAMYSLEFEIDADDLNAARSSTIDRSGSSSPTTYMVGSGSDAREVLAVEEYIVVGDTVTNLEILLRDVFPSSNGIAGSANPEYATFLINFCQSRGTTGDGNMKYLSDRSTHGTDEYWNYPVETLDLMGGDCEDTSILMAALLRAAGFDSGIALLPGHAMAIIGMEPAKAPDPLAGDELLVYGEDYVKKMVFNSKEYWMLETTNSRFLPGEISGVYAFSTFLLFPSESDAVYLT